MGVYHVSGLGKSPGAVCAALHYVHDRLGRRAIPDIEFFRSSGEWQHRGVTADEHQRHAGYLQGLVLLTTPELAQGMHVAYEEKGKKHEGAVLDVVRNRLVQLLPGLAGASASIEFCVISIPHRDFDLAFERAFAVLRALKPRGKTGKEVWVNLTAGDNTLGLALSLAISLTGDVGRTYCTNVAHGQEGRIEHPVSPGDLGTQKDRFWIDVPVVAVQDHDFRNSVMDVLTEIGELSDTELLGRLKQRWTNSEHPLPDIVQFRQQLHAMEAQGLVERTGQAVDGGFTMCEGAHWARVRRFYGILRSSPDATSLRQLGDKFPEWAQWHELSATDSCEA